MTIKEIASATGYSHATVSSVLNGRAAERRISPHTAAQVATMARTLGYIPNIAARRLRSHVVHTFQAVIAVITSFETPLGLVSRAALALQRMIEADGAARTQFTISIEMFHAGHLCDLPGILGNDRFSGAIIANTVEEDDLFLADSRILFPVVLIGRRVPGYASVIESGEAGREAAHLLGRSGCRRGAVLSPKLATPVNRKRVADFISATGEAGLASATEIVCGDRSADAGYVAMRAHLAGPEAADGFFAVSDTLALGAYRAAREAGFSVPRDLCFVGVGDNDGSPYLTPPLTCVGPSEDDLHFQAARLLLGLVTGRERPASPVRLPLQISLRDSTRCGSLQPLKHSHLCR